MRVRPGVAVDLGTVNTRVSAGGAVVDQPSAIAVNRRTAAIEGVGTDADALAGKDPVDIDIIHPVRDGVVADFDAAVAMLQAFLRQLRMPRTLSRPLAVVCVPGGATSLERRSLAAAVTAALPRCVLQFVDKSAAAAAGAGLNPAPGSGAVVVDVGGGTTEVAVLAGGYVVRSRSLRLGGNTMDRAIAQAVRTELGLLLGRDAARKLKMTLGLGELATWEAEAAGVDAGRQTPRVEQVPARLVAAALQPSVTAITGAVSELLAEIPPNLAEDVVRGKIRLAGGGAQLPGLARRIEAAADIAAYVVDDPMQCVIRGATRILRDGYATAGRRPAGHPAAAARAAAG
ncbi:MAG TPA: rod shape-determining protein [Streptosporangiaceae bacterium]